MYGTPFKRYLQGKLLIFSAEVVKSFSRERDIPGDGIFQRLVLIQGVPYNSIHGLIVSWWPAGSGENPRGECAEVLSLNLRIRSMFSLRRGR